MKNPSEFRHQTSEFPPEHGLTAPERQPNPAASDPNQPSTQRLAPLFVLAGVIMVLGYYLAISEHRDPDLARERGEESWAMAPLKIGEAAIDAQAEAVIFKYAATDPQPMVLRMEQNSRIAGANNSGNPDKSAKTGNSDQPDQTAVRSEIALDFEMSVAPQTQVSQDVDMEEREFSEGLELSDDLLAITYDYSAMRAAVFAGQDSHIGSSITTQVAQLIEGSVTRMFIQSNGERAGYEWVAVPNPQARRTLMVIRDAQAFLTPRFMPGAVNPGDTWSYQRPMSVPPDEEGETSLRAEGAVHIESRFEGLLRAPGDDASRYALLHLTLRGEADGKLDDEDEEFHATLGLEGRGAAQLVVDLKTGAVAAADLNFERTLTINPAAGSADDAPIVQQSDMTLELRPRDPALMALIMAD